MPGNVIQQSFAVPLRRKQLGGGSQNQLLPLRKIRDLGRAMQPLSDKSYSLIMVDAALNTRGSVTALIIRPKPSPV